MKKKILKLRKYFPILASGLLISPEIRNVVLLYFSESVYKTDSALCGVINGISVITDNSQPGVC